MSPQTTRRHQTPVVRPAETPGDGKAAAAGASVHITNYAVGCLPLDHEDFDLFSLEVAYRGRGRWAVVRHRYCYDIDGKRDYESIPSERREAWLDRFRFDLDTAIDLAVRIAPTLTVNGMTAADALTDITENGNPDA